MFPWKWKRRINTECQEKTLNDLWEMIDAGQINEAENLLLEKIDYADKEEVMGAALFYLVFKRERGFIFWKHINIQKRRYFLEQKIY